MSAKKSYRSKTLRVKCGYCFIDIKNENLTNHCRNVHQLPPRTKGEVSIEDAFSRSKDESKRARLEDSDDAADEGAVVLATSKVISDEATEIAQVHESDCQESPEPSEDDKTKAEGTPIDNRNNEEFRANAIDIMVGHFEELKKELVGSTQHQLQDISKRLTNLTDDINVIKKSMEPTTSQNQKQEQATAESDFEGDMLLTCRSIHSIVKLFPELEYVEEDGCLYCRICCPGMSGNQPASRGATVLGTFNYDPNNGLAFSMNETLPLQFRHLKSHLKDHLKDQGHKANVETKQKQDEDRVKFQFRNQSIGMRLARFCYTGYKKGRSYADYEDEILQAVKNGLDVGDINHSKDFPMQFRPFVAAEIHSRTTSFMITRSKKTGLLPPLNICADKGTNFHRTRQFITVVTVVPDSDEVLQVIYIGQPVVENHDGNGIAASIKSGLDLFKIHPTQIEGASFDGQYFHLSVPQHLASQYGLNASTFISTWDPMHRAGLVDAAIRKDETFCWLITVQMTCQSIFKKFNWGKNYELLVKACKILDTPMASLKNFSETRFANYARRVFINLRKDYRPVTLSLKKLSLSLKDGNSQEKEKARDADDMLNQIGNIRFCLSLSGITDLYDRFGCLVNICQTVNILPHERYDKLLKVVQGFDEMARAIDHSSCNDSAQESPSLLDEEEMAEKQLCSWQNYHKDLKKVQDSGKYMGVVIDQEQYTSQFPSESNDVIVEVKRNLLSLASRLFKDLRNSIYKRETITVVENIRIICDLKSLAVQIHVRGAVVTGFTNGRRFLKAVRAMTSSVEDVSDVDILENFKKLVGVLDRMTRGKNLKRVTSLGLLKEILSSNNNLSEGIELSLHCICCAAVKVSVESIVESMISVYENHFDSKRQLTEEHALEEMQIAQNGPQLAKADALLKAAMDRYWKSKAGTNAWHFVRSGTSIRDFCSNQSKVVARKLRQASKLPFMG